MFLWLLCLLFLVSFIFFFLFLYSNTIFKNSRNYNILDITKLSNLAYSNKDYRFKDYGNSFNNVIYLNPKVTNFGFVYEE